MAVRERVVVLMTPEQKRIVSDRARDENVSISDYIRRQALGGDELLEGLLSELRASTADATAALDRTTVRLERSAAAQVEADQRARERARVEFEHIDPEALARLIETGDEAEKPSRGS